MLSRDDVIVIGAGPGGLAVSMLLAAAGLKVRVIERLSDVGGRTSTLTEGGFKFDLGPTFFLYPRVLGDIYQTAGRDLDKEVPMIRLDPQYRILFGAGGEIRATSDTKRMVEEISRIAPKDAQGFEAFLRENRSKLEAFKPVMEREWLSWKDLFNPGLLKLLPTLRPHLSMDAYLKRFFKDDRIRLAFSFQSKYLGMSPFKCPSLFSILSFLEYEYGVFHPIGGCGAVSKNMAKIASDLGVDFHLDEPVHDILFRGRKAVGVKTAKGEYHANAIVVNADFARAMTTLVPDGLRSRWKDKSIEKKRFSCSTFMLYLGLDGRVDIPHHNIYISSQYEQNLKDIEQGFRLSEDPSFYVQNPTVTDPSMASPGQSSLYLLAPTPHMHPRLNWQKEAGAFRKRLLDQCRKIGIEDVEKRIVFERRIMPTDWDGHYNIHLGATFNLGHQLSQLLHLRPRNRFEDVDSLYLVGGGTHPGSGLPVIYESARITSRLVLEEMSRSARTGAVNLPMQPCAPTAHPSKPRETRRMGSCPKDFSSDVDRDNVPG